MKNKIFLLLISIAVVFASCERKIDELAVTNGTADFTRFVAVGNSMFAGYADGALYHTGQMNSIPNLISGQLQLAGSGKFVQPVVTSEYGVEFPGSGPKFKLGYSVDCRGITSMGPVADIGQKEAVAPVGYLVNNLAIPGAKSFHMLFPGYAMVNPYYARFATSSTNRVIDEIPALNPTFFSLWLGDNDVLQYALSGGTSVSDSIPSPGFFQNAMGAVIQALTANGAKGVIATIPDVTSIPFFTTIPYNGLTLTKNQADSINMAMGLYQLPFTNYHAGAGNPFLIPDPTSAHPYFKVRQMQPGELVLMTVPQDSMKCYGMGIIGKLTLVPYPIPKKFILTLEDIDKIKTATTSFNAIIKTLADKDHFNLALADMNAKLNELKKGIIWDGITLNANFVSGGAFSLDGIHLNPRGCALTSNYFIDAINAKYGSTVPHVDITKYHGIIFP